MEEYRITNFDLKEIMRFIKTGMYVMPSFQRNYVWKPKQIENILSSLINNYPIGVLTTTNAFKGSVFGKEKNEIIDSLTNTYKNTWIVAMISKDSHHLQLSILQK